MRISEPRELLRIICGSIEYDSSSCLPGQLIFIGGIHGAGKSHLQAALAKAFPDACQLSAGELLNWRSADKRVGSSSALSVNQSILASRILNKKRQSPLTILNGHFCITLSDGHFKYVGDDVFRQISPSLIICMTCEPELIHKRLMARDGNSPDTTLLADMQQKELDRATHVSDLLSIPLIIYIQS